MAHRSDTPRPCPNCGADIPAERGPLAKYCSPTCRGTHWARKQRPPRRVPTALERFNSYLSQPDANGCIVWSGATFGPGGYGAFHLDGRTIGAHRAAWFFAHGSMPDAELLRHTCDNRPCVNIDHLLPGDHFLNARDRVERGRHGTGQYAPMAILTDEQVDEIRRSYIPRVVTARMLAERFGISEVHVYNITSGRVRATPSRPPAGSAA